MCVGVVTGLWAEQLMNHSFISRFPLGAEISFFSKCSSLAQWPTHPPNQWKMGVAKLTTHLHLEPRWRMSGAIPPLLFFTVCTRQSIAILSSQYWLFTLVQFLFPSGQKGSGGCPLSIARIYNGWMYNPVHQYCFIHETVHHYRYNFYITLIVILQNWNYTICDISAPTVHFNSGSFNIVYKRKIRAI